MTVERTITDDQLRSLITIATVLHPTDDDGERDSAWVCAKCGEPAGYRRKRQLRDVYGYDMADAHCFTENCVGGVFCARAAHLMRIEAGHRSDGDRLDRNAVIQLANRALGGEVYAREHCARIIGAKWVEIARQLAMERVAAVLDDRRGFHVDDLEPGDRADLLGAVVNAAAKGGVS